MPAMVWSTLVLTAVWSRKASLPPPLTMTSSGAAATTWGTTAR